MIHWLSLPERMDVWLGTSLGLILLWSVVLPPMVCLAAEPRVVNYRLQDNVPAETVIGNVGLDAGIFKRPVSGSSVAFQLYSPLFWIHAQDGILKTRSAIDRDILCPGKSDCTREINVQVRQRDSGTVSFVKVVLAFDDENDNSPRFGQPEVRVSLSEGSSPGTRLLLPRATDPDSPRYGVQRYALENAPSNVFSLVQINNSGSVGAELLLRSNLDRESVDNYRVHLVAFDGGQPSRSGVAVVVVEVKDVNDNIPIFDRDTYEVWVSEDVQPGTVISRVKATDKDTGMNGQIIYELDPSSQEDGFLQILFRVDRTTGEVIVEDQLDFETQHVHTLIVLARDGGGPDAIPGQVRVVVRLKNYNDNPPDVRIQIPDENDGLRVSESSSPGEFVSVVTVTDEDSKNTTIVCSLNDDHFRLEPLFRNEYKIVTAAEMDRETHAKLVLVVTCIDDGLPPLTSSGNVTVLIEDSNDNRPTFLQDSLTLEVSEDHPTGQPLLGVSAIDSDVGLNAEVRYAVESGDGFSVDPKTGIIFATHPLDRERQEEISLVLTATDLGNPPLSSTVSILLRISDVDDEVPKFSQSSYTFMVNESQPPNTIVGQVHAVDADLPPFNSVRYVLQPEMTESFRVDSEDGVLYTTRELDREITDMEQFQLLACSGSTQADPPAANCSSVEVTVILLDVNDNDPSILYPLPSDTIFIGNRFRIGDPVARIRASDFDSGDAGRLNFRLINQTTDECFRVDENSGEILVARDLTVFTHSTFTLHVVVGDLGSPPRHTIGVIALTVNETLSTVTDERLTMMSGKNLVIVIAIASASGLSVVLLVVAIACLVRSLSAKKVIRQRPNCIGDVCSRSYLVRSDPGARGHTTGSAMSTLQLNPDGRMTVVSNPSTGKPHAVYYDRSLDHATIGHGQVCKWSAGEENDEEEEEEDTRLGSGWKAQHLRGKRRLSLTAPADASDSGRGSSEEVMARNQQEGKFKCHMSPSFDHTFLDQKSQEKSRYTGSSRMPDSLQHTIDKSPQQLIDAKSERELNLLEHTDDPCCETRGLHYPKIPSVHFRSPSIPPWNSKEENGGSIRAVKKSWTDEKDPCFRNHPELLVDCNVFSPDSCGSFV